MPTRILPNGIKPRLLASLVALCCVLVPFLFWQDVWFGRVLTDQELENFLSQPENARQIQHALAQLSERIQKGDRQVRRWYGYVIQLSSHPIPEIRNTAVWLMGQDSDYAEFKPALRLCLKDEDLLVKRNAALSLVRFGDPSGKPELRDMLRFTPISAPASGQLSLRVEEAQEVRREALLLRLTSLESGAVEEVYAPVPGIVSQPMADHGAWVKEGERLLVLAPDPNHVWEALRGLYLIGNRGDLLFIETILLDERLPEPIRNQAQLAMDAIRQRASR